jgi:acyl-CoA thioester hydrolase
MAAVQQTVAYKRELLAGDIVEVRSRLLEIRDKSVRFVHEMRNGETGEIAATCEFVGVHMDRQARKSVPFARDPQRGRNPSRTGDGVNHVALRAQEP